MTLAEQLIAEGEAKGLAKGQVNALSNALRKQLAFKFGELPPATMARLATASLAELDAWLERVLPAKSLDDVFAA